MNETEARTCCFIGHRKISDTPELRERFRCVIATLIQNGTVNFVFGDNSDMFYQRLKIPPDKSDGINYLFFLFANRSAMLMRADKSSSDMFFDKLYRRLTSSVSFKSSSKNSFGVTLR